MTDEFLQTYRQYRDVRMGTLLQYRYALLDLSKFLNKPLEPADWTDDNLNRYLDDARERLRPYTARQRRANLLVIWRFLYEIGTVSTAPRRIRPIKRPELIRTTWTPEQVLQLIRHAQRQRGRFRGSAVVKAEFWEAWIRVSYDTALRTADQFALRIDYVQASGGRFEVVMQKTGKRHAITLRPHTMAAIERLCKGASRQHVFPKLWKANGFCRAFKRFVAGAGLVGTPKIMRSTSATEVERENPGTAWRHLGHSEPTTSVRHYLGPRAYADRPLPPLPEVG